MHPVQASEAIQWAERQHLELVAHAERDHLARRLHQFPLKPDLPTTSNVTALTMRLAIVALMVLVAVAAI